MSPSSSVPAKSEKVGTSDQRIRLDQIDTGHCGKIAAVQAGADQIEQLKAMGVCVGRKVVLVRSGDPLVLKVLGSRIGVSARLAAQVLVVPCQGDAFGQE